MLNYLYSKMTRCYILKMASRLFLVVGTTQFLAVVGLRFLFSCWLSARGWFYLLGGVKTLSFLDMGSALFSNQ